MTEKIVINGKSYFVFPEKYAISDGTWKDGYILRPTEYPEEVFIRDKELEQARLEGIEEGKRRFQEEACNLPEIKKVIDKQARLEAVQEFAKELIESFVIIDVPIKPVLENMVEEQEKEFICSYAIGIEEFKTLCKNQGVK